MIRKTIRGAFPRAYGRTRNAVSLAALYARRAFGRDTDSYPREFWEFHDVGDWPGFARAVLVHAVGPRRIADVGCGQGLALAALAGVDPSLELRGFDGSAEARKRAAARGLDVRPLDVTALDATRRRALAQELASFDLVLCLEVAEHLPPWHAGHLLEIVAAPARLIFSAAALNQGGRDHVNEQPAEYWIARLGQRGLRLSPRDAAFRADVAALDLPWWYRQNMHLFERA